MPSLVRRSLVVSLIMPHIGYEDAGTDAASHRRLNVDFRACLRYIHFLRRLYHVYHLATCFMDTSLADYASIQLLSVSLQSVACSACVLFIFAISFCFARA
jgi:hypothetical protein